MDTEKQIKEGVYRAKADRKGKLNPNTKNRINTIGFLIIGLPAILIVIYGIFQVIASLFN